MTDSFLVSATSLLHDVNPMVAEYKSIASLLDIICVSCTNGLPEVDVGTNWPGC